MSESGKQALLLIAITVCLVLVLNPNALSSVQSFGQRRSELPRRVLSQAEMQQFTTTANTGEIVMVGANGVLIDQGTQALRVGTSDVTLITGGAERLKVMNDGVVKINTTNKDALYWYDSATNNMVGGLGNANGADKGWLGLYDAAVQKVALRANGVSTFTGGNVGIGVTNPSTALQVNGHVNLNGALQTVDSDLGYTAASFAVAALPTGVQGGTLSGTYRLTALASQASMAMNLIGFTFVAGVTYKYTFTGMSGSVALSLTVLQNTSTTTVSNTPVTNNVTTTAQTITGQFTPSNVGGNLAFNFQAASANPFVNWTGFTLTRADKTTVLVDHQLGIGTTNPVSNAKLDVAGRAVVGRIAGTAGGIILDNETAYGGSPCIQGVTSAFGVNNIGINPAGGNVGIGTTNPLSPLTIFSNGWSLLGLNTSSSVNAVATQYNPVGTLSGTNPTWFVGHKSSYHGPLSIWAYDGTTHLSNAITINGNGNVGIGTANPTALLHLSKQYANYSILTINGVDFEPQNYSLSLNQVVTTPGGIASFDYNFDRKQWNGFYGTQLGLKYNGNVGIGTNDPYHKFQVVGGNIVCHKHTSDTSGDRVYSGLLFSDNTSNPWTPVVWCHLRWYDDYYNLAVVRTDTANINRFAIYRNTREDFNIDSNANAWIRGVLTQNSDVRLKKNIKPLFQSLSVISLLNPVSYHFNAQSDDDPIHFGLIAQEVQQLLPNVVKKNEHDEHLSLNYIELVPILIKGMQEQQQTIQDLNTRLQRLESLLSR